MRGILESGNGLKAENMSSAIVIKQFYPYLAEHIWDVLTAGRYLKLWLMRVDLKPQPGCEFHFLADLIIGQRHFIYCRVVDVRRLESIAYTWQAGAKACETLVKWSISSQKGGSILTLEQAGFKGMSGMNERAVMTKIWKNVFAQVLPGVFKDNFKIITSRELKSHYE